MFKLCVLAMVLAAANAGVISSGWGPSIAVAHAPVAIAHVATPVAVKHVATSWQNNNQISVNPVIVKSAVPVVHAAPIAVAHSAPVLVSSHGWNGGW